MDFEDDFLFEEDKILMSENPMLNSPVQLSDSLEGTTLVDISDCKTTVPLAKVDLHQSNTMKDCIPEVELVAQDQFTYFEHSQQHLEQMGMTITSGNVVIEKDSNNLIGISIGGGAPFCPCLYIVQVFDNTPAAQDGTLEAGDEMIAVNGESLKGKTKVEVAKMIQACENKVCIIYNRLHADVQQGKTIDIILKKVKHRLVEKIGSGTADALGLSRAILCNDILVQRLDALEKTENFYKGLVAHAKSVLHAFFDLFQIYKVFGDAFASMGVKEPQPRASEAFTQFGEMHRQIEKLGIEMLKTVKPIISDLGTYLHKAIPDTRLTISKYADAKFEYLSYCLKVKEMDDEEQSCIAIQEPLYRVETGNYEYRLILRCRQHARVKFAKLRSDVLVKLELLDNKHVDDIVQHLTRFSSGLETYFKKVHQLLSENQIFPVEIDLPQSVFQYKQDEQVTTPYQDEEEEEGACGFDPSKILDFDIAEEAKPSCSTSSSAMFDLSEVAGPSGMSTTKKRSDLSDLVDLSGFSDMNEKFDQLLSLDDKRTESTIKAGSTSAHLTKTKKKTNEKDNLQTLLSLEKSDKTMPVSSLGEKKSKNDESFLLLESQQTMDTLKQKPGQKNPSDSLLFPDPSNEPLIKIETN